MLFQGRVYVSIYVPGYLNVIYVTGFVNIARNIYYSIYVPDIAYILKIR